MFYKVTAYYDAASEGGLLWSDPALGVDWRVDAAAVVVNARDQALPTLDCLISPFRFEAAV